jgi:hypothetical protein
LGTQSNYKNPWKIRFCDRLDERVRAEVKVVVPRQSQVNVEFVEHVDHVHAYRINVRVSAGARRRKSQIQSTGALCNLARSHTAKKQPRRCTHLPTL